MGLAPISTVDMCDATHANITHLPPGQSAGYLTGSGGVAWTPADWQAHPGAVRIDQSPVITAFDSACDFIDYENGAVTRDELARLVRAAQDDWLNGTRPGQRWPGVYASMNSITEVVNTLIAGHITSGVPLGVANFSMSRQEAVNMVALAGGPFPVVWAQYADAGLFDRGIVSVPWLKRVSVTPPSKTGNGGMAQPVSPSEYAHGGMNVIIVKVTAPAGQAWEGTRTFLYGGATLHHIVSGTDHGEFVKALDEVEITWDQFVALGGLSVTM